MNALSLQSARGRQGALLYAVAYQTCKSFACLIGTLILAYGPRARLTLLALGTRGIYHCVFTVASNQHGIKSQQVALENA